MGWSPSTGRAYCAAAMPTDATADATTDATTDATAGATADNRCADGAP